MRCPLLPAVALAWLALGSGPARAAEPPPLTVFAAADLVFAFKEIVPRFEKALGVRVTLVLGSTGQLAQQIEHGGPADVFFAADQAFVDRLVAERVLLGETRALYAQGRIVLATARAIGWKLTELRDLTGPNVRHVAIGNPAHAPYGKADDGLVPRLALPARRAHGDGAHAARWRPHRPLARPQALPRTERSRGHGRPPAGAPAHGARLLPARGDRKPRPRRAGTGRGRRRVRLHVGRRRARGVRRLDRPCDQVGAGGLRDRGSAAGAGRSHARALRVVGLLERDAAAGLAVRSGRGCAGVLPGARRVRDHTDGGGEHPGPDANPAAGDLRPRAGRADGRGERARADRRRRRRGAALRPEPAGTASLLAVVSVEIVKRYPGFTLD